MPELVPSSLVLEIGNKIVGVIAGKIVNHIVNKEPLFQEVIWYVSKEHRRYGIKLYRGLEEYCHDNSIHQIVMVNMGNLKNSSFEKFYKSEGYELLETQYIKTLEA